ncbi:hypothetical protein [Deinococcus sp.]|uniref:hypothetical protein n=1 Tax=Deinococcus sp. TaxID=47478 RepID=UPI003C7B6051
MKPSGPLSTMLGVSALVALVVTLLLTVFAWPVVNTAPNKLPVGLVASGSMATRLPQLLERARPGAFTFTAYGSEDQARQAVLRREVYGAFLLDLAHPTDFKVLTASAGSPAAAQVIGAVGAQLGTLLSAAGFGAPNVEDVVPTTTDDPRQATLIGSVLPVVISGIIGGLLLGTRLQGSAQRMLAALLLALVAGFSMTAVMQYGFRTLPGSYFSNALVTSLALAAVVSFVTGLVASLGVRGLGVAGFTLMLVSNPFSALSSAPEMLPGVWGAIGQLLPLGAFGHALRSVAFFSGYGASGPLWVLGGWVLLGLALILLGSRQRSPASRQVSPAGAIS